MTSHRAEGSAAERSLDAHARFTRLVHEHQRSLFAHVRVVYPHVDADTVVNEAFTAAWQRIDDVPDPGAGTWLRSAVRYVVMNRRRGERRWQALNDRVARLDPVGHVPAPDHEAGLQLRVVLDALASLSPADREVLLMTAVDDLSPDDVAEILGISPSAAKARVSRARSRLRAAITTGSGPSHDAFQEGGS
jgi:RNA polymerase sigma factor (sigma-70 family)